MPVKKNENKKIFYDIYKYSFPEIIKYSSVGLAVGITVCWLCYHSIYSAPLAAMIMLIYLKKKNINLRETRRKTLLFHFKDFLGSLHTSLNAGYSIENGIKETLADMKKMYGDRDVITRETNVIIAGLNIGRPIEDLFYDLGERSKLDDIRLFSELLAIGKRHGGRLGKILGDTKYIICGKIDTEQEIDKQLSSKKYEQKIMSLMPACVLIYMRLTFTGFVERLYGNLSGIIVMSICLAVYACAYHMGEKIVNIEI